MPSRKPTTTRTPRPRPSCRRRLPACSSWAAMRRGSGSNHPPHRVPRSGRRPRSSSIPHPTTWLLSSRPDSRRWAPRRSSRTSARRRRPNSVARPRSSGSTSSSWPPSRPNRSDSRQRHSKATTRSRPTTPTRPTAWEADQARIADAGSRCRRGAFGLGEARPVSRGRSCRRGSRCRRGSPRGRGPGRTAGPRGTSRPSCQSPRIARAAESDRIVGASARRPNGPPSPARWAPTWSPRSPLERPRSPPLPWTEPDRRAEQVAAPAAPSRSARHQSPCRRGRRGPAVGPPRRRRLARTRRSGLAGSPVAPVAPAAAHRSPRPSRRRSPRLDPACPPAPIVGRRGRPRARRVGRARAPGTGHAARAAAAPATAASRLADDRARRTACPVGTAATAAGLDAQPDAHDGQGRAGHPPQLPFGIRRRAVPGTGQGWRATLPPLRPAAVGSGALLPPLRAAPDLTRHCRCERTGAPQAA